MHFKNYISNNWLLLLILLVATILRFWNFFEIPLTHDEVSALNRTHFENFEDLIELGAKADTHPPGVQVFTYYWVKAFGYEQWIVKLPFILMGLGSLILSYSIFKKWSNETATLLIVSFLAILQFTVMYSQIARPYISGMFLILGMVYFWDGLVNRPEKGFWKNLILTSLFGAACGYNHHFSLLAAFIIGLTGVFIINRTYRFKYLLVGVFISLLYLPNLSIFLYQLDRGGVGEWLGAPTPRFILDFFSYSFNHSLSLMVVLVLLLGVGIYNFNKGSSPKWNIVAGIWFFSIWIIGYYYSVYRNPVLQFSMLLFFFPFLLYFLMGWIPQLSKKTRTILVLLVLVIGTSSLAIHRKHFEVFYANRYFQMKEDAAKCDPDNTCFVFATYPHFLTIDFPKNIDFPSEYLAWEENANSIKEFEEYIATSNKEKLFLGHVEQFPKELIAIAHHYYPNIVEINYCSGAASYLFSNGWEYQDLSYREYDIISEPTINFYPEKTNKSNYYKDADEWSIGAEVPLSDLVEHHYDIVSVSATVKLSDPNQEVILVSEIHGESETEPLFWAGKPSKEHLFNPMDSTVNIVLAFSLENINRDIKKLPPLKTYIWNVSKESVEIQSFNIEILKGNRIKYCLYEDF